MNINQYLSVLQERYARGIATEHSYRGDLQQLLETLLPKYQITNEPRRSKVGAPDYIITQDTVARGYIEAKDVDKSLDDKGYKEQFSRYRDGLPNLIITNYHEFRYYQEGILVKTIHLAHIDTATQVLTPNPKSFEEFEALIKDFPTHIAQTIRSSKRLSQLMASKARLLKEAFAKSLKDDIEDSLNADTELLNQFASFKELLIKDINPDQFADLYAQTIAYGMFAARSKDPTLDTFNRQEAAELIPKTNPFLRKLFQYIAGYDLDMRLSWIIDGLADVFRATDVEGILHNFGKSTKMQDPIVHFYEDFLKEYNPGLRIERGVWYTPLPVVEFIVRAVDDVLKEDFGLSSGIADKSKIEIEVDTDMLDKRTLSRKRKNKKQVHRVQILDPATGTGTFLAQVVRHIHATFEGMEGLWPQYVNQDLIPRLNGFELLMASYAMAHLKLDLLLQETGYHSNNFDSTTNQNFPTGEMYAAGGQWGSANRKENSPIQNQNQRFNIFLTNSLEPGIKEVPNLFMNQWLTTESQEASRIKSQTPVMVVLGNPPYSGESANKGKYIMDLMDAYKKEPGGKQKLQERNSKSVNDDYVKFIRMSQNLVEKTKEGVVAFINPHGFLDNPTFRGMRWHLLKTFDKIYTLDLHGNAKKKETAPDGSKDDNVFDIQQGVSINIFIKTGKKKKTDLGEVFHYDLYGRRESKYYFLEKNNLKDIAFAKVPNVAPNYFMVPKNLEFVEEYNSNLSLTEIFKEFNSGVKTHRDLIVIDSDKNILLDRIRDFLDSGIKNIEFEELYGLKLKTNSKKRNSKVKLSPDNIRHIDYRPFDKQYIYYDSTLVDRGREDLVKHINDSNLVLIFSRQSTHEIWSTIQITNCMVDNRYHFSYKGIPQQAPLYLDNNISRTPNLNNKIVHHIGDGLKLSFLPDHEIKNLQKALQSVDNGADAYSGWKIPSEVANPDFKLDGTKYFTPLDILDYIYATLHSPSYREKYKEFLKTDFPRIPWPTDKEKFFELVDIGSQLRDIHLMKAAVLDKSPVTYPAAGTNIIDRKLTKTSPGWEPHTISNQNASSSAVKNVSNNKLATASSSAVENQALGKVWINDTQYFDNVPQAAWEFYIGGYQPAQKWLKDRKDRELTIEDVQHYRKIIKALIETERLMGEVDNIAEF